MTTETGRNVSTAGYDVPPGAAAPAPKVNRSRPRSFDRQFAAAQLAIAGAMNDPAIQELLGPYGYSQERIAGEGYGLLLQAMQSLTDQSVAAGEMVSARDERDRVYRLARQQHTRDVALARVVLRDNRGALQKLNLHTRRKEGQAGWLVQARQFYSVAIGDAAIQQQLAEAALTLDKLEAGKSLVDAVDACMLAYASARAAAQAARQRRQETMQRLNAWMADFRAIARVALRGRPQLLGKLGL